MPSESRFHLVQRRETRKTPEILRFQAFSGAGGVTRTHDLLITNQLLYRLSYTSGSVRSAKNADCLTDEWYFSILFPSRQEGSSCFFRFSAFLFPLSAGMNNTSRNQAEQLASRSPNGADFCPLHTPPGRSEAHDAPPRKSTKQVAFLRFFNLFRALFPAEAFVRQVHIKFLIMVFYK